MRIYSIFDDFDTRAIDIIKESGIELSVHPLGQPRPNNMQMKKILETYDGVIIGTSQKITPDMFDNIGSFKIIATASVGLDHINIPDKNKNDVIVFNTPTANAQSVAEYTIATILSCVKRLEEGKQLYVEGKNNKHLLKKPEDVFGKTIGVIGAGNISQRIMQYADMLGMSVVYWTAHPDKYDLPYEYVTLDQLALRSDFISVNLPNNSGTKGIISKNLIDKMKEDCVFISVSRLPAIDIDALIDKAQQHTSFYVNVDIDIDDNVVKNIQNMKNISITPHIAGGTIETRKRMFVEVAEKIANYVRLQD